MNMAVPESRNNGLAGAIDDTGILGNRNVAAAADRGDDAAGGVTTASGSGAASGDA
jgi:hypothetical protein